MRLSSLLKTMVIPAFALFWGAQAGAAGAPTDRGPAIGERIAFVEAMQAQDGKRHDLANLHGANGTAIVFNRSLAWCPFCKKQTEDLIANAALLTDAGYNIAVVTYDAPDVLAAYAAEQKASFPLLSDTGSATIKALGLLNETYEPGSFAYGIPHPMIIVVGPDNTVKAKFAEEGYKVRPALQDVVKTLSMQ
jgi:peroxiredoxin Q/BCP